MVIKMANLLVNTVYVLLFVIIILFLDLKYFKNDFWKRLIVNVLVVIVALAIYYLFLGYGD
jgi:hypothetical protein